MSFHHSAGYLGVPYPFPYASTSMAEPQVSFCFNDPAVMSSVRDKVVSEQPFLGNFRPWEMVHDPPPPFLCNFRPWEMVYEPSPVIPTASFSIQTSHLSSMTNTSSYPSTQHSHIQNDSSLSTCLPPTFAPMTTSPIPASKYTSKPLQLPSFTSYTTTQTTQQHPSFDFSYKQLVTNSEPNVFDERSEIITPTQKIAEKKKLVSSINSSMINAHEYDSDTYERCNQGFLSSSSVDTTVNESQEDLSIAINENLFEDTKQHEKGLPLNSSLDLDSNKQLITTASKEVVSEETDHEANAPKDEGVKPSPLAGVNVMNVILVAAECAPWIKTGGLGDVTGALPKALARRGHRIMIMAPLYGNYVEPYNTEIRKMYTVEGHDMEVTYLQAYIDGVDLLFIKSPKFRHRRDNRYRGNHTGILKRLVLFYKTAVEVPWHVPGGGVYYGDGNLVFIANDWHTALLKAYYHDNRCMLQYVLLHLIGYDSVLEEELKQISQWGSRTVGHPENFETPGVEVTTGPLGQGVANVVGLAIVEKHLAPRFNKQDSVIIDHYTYVILRDGCRMEGISNEAGSLTGHWGLGKLIAFYDDNHISIDGDTEIAFTKNVGTRCKGRGWHVNWVKNGNTGYDDIRAAIKKAKAVTDKPILIKVATKRFFRSPNKTNLYSVHGSALGAKVVDATWKNPGWHHDPFRVPEDVKQPWSRHASEGAEWNAKFAEHEKKYAEEAAELKFIITEVLPSGWESALPKYTLESPSDATRNHSQSCLNAFAPIFPGLLDGSADLDSFNMTLLKMFGDFQKGTPEERNVKFGGRKYGMGAICDGITLHSPGRIPYCATFSLFTDYMRAAIKISALSKARVIYWLMEDGPIHQPMEYLASIRAMPKILMLRPVDGNETVGAYKVAVVNRKRPSTLGFSRQKLWNITGTSLEGVEKGGYTISDKLSGNKPNVLLIRTGSELRIAAKSANELIKEGKTIRVVSFVSWELYDKPFESFKVDEGQVIDGLDRAVKKMKKGEIALATISSTIPIQNIEYDTSMWKTAKKSIKTTKWLKKGIGLHYDSKELEQLQIVNSDLKMGVQIIQNTLKAYVHAIASNAGAFRATVISELFKKGELNLGYDTTPLVFDPGGSLKVLQNDP